MSQVLEDNEELRRSWDTHMEGIRIRVHNIIDDESEDEDENDDIDSTIANDDQNTLQLWAAVHSLKKEVLDMDCRLIEVEQYSRRESLVISGIPGNVPQKDLERTVLNILYFMGFEHLREDDIVACHRLWAPRNSRHPARVIVKFLNRKVVEWCLSHLETLENVSKNMGLTLSLSESICAKNNETSRICKWLVDEGQIYKFFTRNGFVKIVAKEGDNPEKILHPELLREKFDNIPDFFS